jgi:hypothetical protein
LKEDLQLLDDESRVNLETSTNRNSQTSITKNQTREKIVIKASKLGMSNLQFIKGAELLKIAESSDSNAKRANSLFQHCIIDGNGKIIDFRSVFENQLKKTAQEIAELTIQLDKNIQEVGNHNERDLLTETIVEKRNNLNKFVLSFNSPEISHFTTSELSVQELGFIDQLIQSENDKLLSHSNNMTDRANLNIETAVTQLSDSFNRRFEGNAFIQTDSNHRD